MENKCSIFTKHFTQRIQERNVDRNSVKDVLKYGTYKTNHGKFIITIDFDALERGSECGKDLQNVFSLSVVQSYDGTLITTFWQTTLTRPHLNKIEKY